MNVIHYLLVELVLLGGANTDPERRQFGLSRVNDVIVNFDLHGQKVAVGASLRKGNT